MFRSIQMLMEKISSLVGKCPFSSGFIAGLAAACAFLLFLLLLYIVSRPHKLRCIVIPAEGGILRIDAKAVQGAVRAVANNFPAFDVRRVGLYGTQKNVELQVAMDFNGAIGVSVSDLSAQFRAAVARMTTETFGMASPARIEVEILRSFADIPVSDGESSSSAGASPSECFHSDAGSC